MNPLDLLVEVINEHAEKNIWVGSPVIGYRQLGNTNRGEVGEEFIRRYLTLAGFTVGNGGRTSPTDLRIGETRFEVKTASQGAKGNTFQFNHVRLDRQYDHLLCLGICPREIRFGIWRKGEVAEGKAGKLTRMAEGQAVTYKIRKNLADLARIEELPVRIRQLGV